MTCEADIQSDILVAITALPDVLAWRANSGVGRTAAGNLLRANVPGCADILACCRGRFVGLEVKRPRGRPLPSQRAFRAAVERAGGVYAVVRSPDDALAVLRAIQ